MKLSINPEALSFLIPLFLVGSFFCCVWYLTHTHLFLIVGMVFLLSGGMVLYFFRDPVRESPALATGDILSPADGKVVAIRTIDEPVFIQGPAIRVSIFLSIFDVHINRIPFSGIVKYKYYTPGKFMGAFFNEASTRNENISVGIMGDNNAKIYVKQIAGMIARRIVCKVNVGEKVQVGSRYGLIKFGSRVDLFVPVGTKIAVKVGDKVAGGLTLIGNTYEQSTKN